jgi:hypothetical protein
LPLSVVIAPPGAGLTKTIYLTTRLTQTGGLQSLNQWAAPYVIDETGALVTETLHAPSSIAATSCENCMCRITATYQGGYDDDPATHFYVWITTDGSAPNPALAATYTEAMIPNGLDDSNYLSYLCGHYAHASLVKVLVRAYRSGDAVYSANTTIVTEEISTAALRGPDTPLEWDDDLLATVRGALAMPSFTLTESTTGSIHWQCIRGQIRFYFNTTLAFVITDREFRTEWSVLTADIGGASAKNGVEVIDANTAYLAINSVRVMKLDLAALEITMISQSFTGPTGITYQKSGPIYVTATEISFQNWVNGMWKTVATLSAAGDFSIDSIRYCSSSAEMFA